MRRLLKPFRWLRAFFGGYFWLSCPVCGEKYGGFEIGGSLMLSWNEERGVCKGCTERAKEQNIQFMKDCPAPTIYIESGSK